MREEPSRGLALDVPKEGFGLTEASLNLAAADSPTPRGL